MWSCVESLIVFIFGWSCSSQAEWNSFYVGSVCTVTRQVAVAVMILQMASSGKRAVFLAVEGSQAFVSLSVYICDTAGACG